MKLLKTSELKPGMKLVDSVVTPTGQHLAKAGEELTKQLINKMKLYRVESAFVDVPKEEPKKALTPQNPSVVFAKQEALPENQNTTYIEESKTHSQKVMASQEFKGFQMDYIVAINNLKSVFNGVIKQELQINEKALVESIASLFVSRNTITEVFDMIHQMHSMEDSVYAHCINVALISRMIGRWLHLEPHDLDILTCCGLLHDIGKLSIPEEILNKPGKLTDEEFEIIKSHPKAGYEYLRNQNIDSRIKRSALMHHERYDGSGYPNGLTSDLLSDYAMIVAIADVYDAMTAARSYRMPLCPFQVIANFEADGFQKYHTKYIFTFLNHIASTYANNRVMLNDGRACKIVMLNKQALSRPMVRFDDGEYLDLSTQHDLQITRIL